MRLRGKALSPYTAFLIVAVVGWAIVCIVNECLITPRRASDSVDFNLRAVLSYVESGSWEHIVIVSPSPQIKVYFSIRQKFFNWEWDSDARSSNAAFGTDDGRSRYMGHVSIPQIWEIKPRWQSSNEVVLAGVHSEILCRSDPRIIPNWPDYERYSLSA